MNGSEFLKSWKKAKPLLLTDTGVSDLLRKLPDDPSQAQLKLYAKAADELGKHIANPKIKAEKKALACLQAIQKEIRDGLDHTAKMRVKAVDLFKAIHATARKYHATLTTGKPTRDQVASFPGDVADFTRPMEMITASGRDMVIVPPEHMIEFRGYLDRLRDLSTFMVKLHDDAATKEPKMDPKTMIPKCVNEFGVTMAKLPAVWAKVESLDY